ncbi:unnamed protein product [Linum trigynum]|uniref:Uncharacterized protein n=1 Tax=Linum trigynum TaxID=586398 RepID=A0AAV2ENB6_9ROSI
MLSKENSEIATPAPALLPSDRPPDPLSPHTLASAPGAINSTALSSDLSDMVVDVSMLPVQDSPADATTKQGAQFAPMEATNGSTNGGKPVQTFSYAKAVMAMSTPTTSPNQLAVWTPVGEHDLVTGSRNGEPSLTISPEFK